jgi:hypothetical protein
MVPLPMSSSEISRAEMPAIYLGPSPDRDRAIDEICQMIRNCARAGIQQVKYNFTIIGIPRSGTAPGRGRSRYSEFIYAGAKQDPPLTIAGRVDADTYWERITYFLERVVPVAEEYKVKMGCHPQDPGVPKGTGWRGVEPCSAARRLETVRGDQGRPTRPGFARARCRAARKAGRTDLDVIRAGSRRDLQRAFPQHRRQVPQLPRNLHDNGSVDMLRRCACIAGRLRRHDDATNCPRSRRGQPAGFAYAFGASRAPDRRGVREASLQ